MAPRGDARIQWDQGFRPGEPNPWNGIKYLVEGDSESGVHSSTLPSAACILYPVFVTSKNPGIDRINYLLHSSRSIDVRELTIEEELAEAQKTEKEPFIKRLILPQLRDPHYQLEPTEWPVSAQDIRFPFIGKSFSAVFAAWVGSDEVCLKDGVSPYRHNRTNTEDKMRFWSMNTFLILDDESFSESDDEKATALVAYLKHGVTEEKEVQTIRCELAATLRFMSFMEGDQRPIDLNFVRENVASKDGILRFKDYDGWVGPGGWGEAEVLAGKGPFAAQKSEVQDELRKRGEL